MATRNSMRAGNVLEERVDVVLNGASVGRCCEEGVASSERDILDTLLVTSKYVYRLHLGDVPDNRHSVRVS